MEPSSSRPPFTIGTLAREAGVNVETVRYYQRRGLLRQPQKPLGGVRSYCDGDLSRLRLIKHVQRLQFTLTEIADLLAYIEDGDCYATKALAQDKLKKITRQITALEKVRDILKLLTINCSGKCAENCPVIRELRQQEFALMAEPDAG